MSEQYTYDNLKNNAFAVRIDRIPQTMFRVVSGDIPAITIPAVETSFPGVDQSFSGTKEVFEDLILEFIVDVDMKNYEEIYHWITQQKYAVTPDEFTPKNGKEEDLYSDGVFIIMNSSSNPHRVFSFKEMFPVSLGSLHFDTSITDAQPVQCMVTFKYSRFELKPIDTLKGVQTPSQVAP